MYKLFTKEWLGDLTATILLIIGFLLGISLFREISLIKLLIFSIIFLTVIGSFIVRPFLREVPLLKPMDGVYALVFFLVFLILVLGIPYTINLIMGIFVNNPIIFWAFVLLGIAIFVIFIGSVYNDPIIFRQKQPYQLPSQIYKEKITNRNIQDTKTKMNEPSSINELSPQIYEIKTPNGSSQIIKTYYDISTTSRINPEKGGTWITIEDIDKMEGTEFELFLKKIFEKIGYLVDLTPHTNDMGADLILSKQNERISVQAKRWEGNVTATAIQEVVGSLKCYKTKKGIVVTNSEFTKHAIKMAQHNNIELWNRKKLIEIVNDYPIIL